MREWPQGSTEDLVIQPVTICQSFNGRLIQADDLTAYQHVPPVRRPTARTEDEPLRELAFNLERHVIEGRLSGSLGNHVDVCVVPVVTPQVGQRIFG